MPVEEEYAELYPLTAEDLINYLPDVDCGECGVASCAEFAEQLIEGKNFPSNCPKLDDNIKTIMEKVLKLELPLIPTRFISYDKIAEAVPPALIKIGHPTSDSVILVTGNFKQTVSILELALGETHTDAFLLIIDTKGFAVDNAMTLKTFNPSEILKTLTESGVGAKVSQSRLIIPGLARSIAADIREKVQWDVVVGPVSGMEIPLYLTKLA